MASRVPNTIQQQPTASPAVARRPFTLAREQRQSRAENAIQENTRRAIAAASTIPFLNGNLLQKVNFTVGGSIILLHKLARAWEGFMLVTPKFGSAGSAYVVYVPATDPRLDQFQITLASAGTFQADVWVW